jgi:hypothetical protein
MDHSNVAENQDDGNLNLPALFEAAGLDPLTAYLEKDKDGRWWIGSSVAVFTEIKDHTSEKEVLEVTLDSIQRMCDDLNEESMMLQTFLETYYGKSNS